MIDSMEEIVPSEVFDEFGLTHILGGSLMTLLDCNCKGTNSNMADGLCECPWSNENVSDTNPNKDVSTMGTCSCIFTNANGSSLRKKRRKKK